MKLSPKLALLLALCSVQVLTYAQTSYTDPTATGAWNTNRWNNTSDSGSYISAFTENNDVLFTTGTYEFTGGMGSTVNVGDMTLSSETTVTFYDATGLLGTGGTVSTIDVGTGSRLDLGAQEFSTVAGNGFIKNGAGVLLLGSASASTYSGGFTLNAGAVVSRGISSFGQGATNVLTLNGGILASSGSRVFDTTYFGGGIVVGGNVQIGALSSAVTSASSSGAMSFTNNMSLGAGNRTFTVGNNAVHTFGGIISNTAGGMTFSRLAGVTGSLNITNLANTFSGDVTITGGRVNFSGDGSLGNASNNVIIDGGVFSTASSQSYTIASSRTLYLGDGANSAINTEGSAILTVSNGLVNKTGETGNLVKLGTGTLSLTGANTYSGSTTISGGSLRLFGNSSLSGGNYSGNISIASGAKLDYETTATQTLSGSISGAGSLQITSGTLTLSSANSLSGSYTVKNGGTLNLTSGAAINGAQSLVLEAGAKMDNSSNGAITIASSATKSIGTSLTYLGSAGQSLTMGGGNTSFTGASGSDTLFNVVAGELAFSSSTSGSGISLTKTGTGTLTFSNLQSDALSGTTNVSQGTLRIVGNSSLGSNTIDFNVGAGASLSLDGNLSWNGSYTLNNNSQLIRQTTSVISANANYAANRTLTSADGLTNGQHTIQSGVTITATSDLFGSTPTSAVADRIMMEDASIIRSTASFALNENKGVMLLGTGTIGASAGQTLTINSSISGEDGFLRIGGTSASGVVALNGVNAYLGTTTVSSGTLLVNGSIGSTQKVTVASGSGSIAGSLHFNSGAIWHIGSLGQSLTVAGPITFGGAFGIANLTGINWNTVDNGTYTLISTSQTFNGKVSNFGIENAYSLGNGRSAYFQNGSLAMVVIPEPSVAILTGLGACALLRRRRSAS
jgi:autotransporter-associated beta strand protein